MRCASPPETYVEQRLEFLLNLRHVFQQRQRFFNRCIEQLRDRLAFEFYRKRFAVVASTTANVAKHVHVWQKVHLDALHAVTFTGFTAAALDVE
jgi:hypothetical protein